MEFRNLTPFDALSYRMMDARDQEYRVVVMRVGYRLVRADGPAAAGDLYRAEVIDREPMPLVMSDEYFGETDSSSVRSESDLAPFKPRCDVLFHGSSHSPGGRPARRWEARMRLTASVPAAPAAPEPEPQPLNPRMALTESQRAGFERARRAQAESAGRTDVLLDKRLSICGPRRFRKRWLWGWRLGRPEPATQVAARYEHAFGGHSTLPDPRAAAAVLLDEACFLNPVGCGWIDPRLLTWSRKARLSRPRSLPAPQIEYPRAPTRALRISRHPGGPTSVGDMPQIARRYKAAPAGLSPLGRAWTPRIQKAGSYDAAWLEQRWPLLPHDFDFAYWNCAPEDQQIAYPPADVAIDLWNLSDADASPSGQLSTRLPGHRAFVLAWLEGGVPLPMRSVIDTLVIDTEAMTVACVWRCAIPCAWPLQRLEARFETDPLAPLVKFKADDHDHNDDMEPP